MTRAWTSFALLAAAAAAALAPFGCSSPAAPPPPKPTGTAQELRDPATCKACHAGHYDDWSRSMHAYASEDPVFLAMNARGQRETNGALGTFCVQCHAPVAVKDGLTKDGLNLGQLPAAEKNVTCFFCHSIDSVGPSHVNADVNIASDLVMRGEIPDPKANSVHASAASNLQDSAHVESAQMCGSCHDIVSPQGGHIERTFQEWQTSIFAPASTCAFNGNCHMKSSDGVAVALNGPARTFHSHDFPAVDIAFDPSFPPAADQQATVEASLANVLQGALCVNVLGGVRVFLDAAGVAHFWPSGASQDRRAWAEVVAYKNGAQFYQSGSVAPGVPVGSDPDDKDLWVLRDQMFDANDKPVDMFWQAACAAGNELQVISSTDPMNMANYTHRERLYPLTANPGDSKLAQMPDRVTLAMHLQPIGLDVLDDLVATKDLDPSIVAQMPTLSVALPNPTADGGVASTLEWTAATATGGYTDVTTGVPMSCVSTLSFNIAPTQFAADPPTSCPGQTPPPPPNDAGAPPASDAATTTDAGP
jgi:Cytochrome c554 and c-prime